MLPEIFVLLMVMVSVQGTEPECSRFHYEEQTLEKMIRQEIRLEAMKAEMGETKKQVDSALEALKQEQESFKIEMEEMKKTQSLEKERGKIYIPGIAFQAKVSKNIQPTNGETLVFKNTVFDFGNGYNNQTGLYTATKSGLYLFSLHLCLSFTNGFMFYQVFTQEGVLFTGRFVAAGGNYLPCFSSQVLINLQHGDRVGVKRTMSSVLSGNVISEVHGQTEGVFSGVLLNSNI